MPNQQPPLLKVNEWIENSRFSYMFFWPYAEELNPEKAEIDVRVRPYDSRYRNKTFIGTFITQNELPRTIENLFEELAFGKECADGTYVPLKYLSDRILIREISEQTVTRTIDNLLKTNSFEEFFIEES